MPSHLHRRPSLRQPMPSRRRALLLPPHHPQTHHRSPPSPLPPHRLRSAPARGSLRHPILHRPGPPAHRLQRHRLTPRRTPPLRPPDRKPQSAPRSRPPNHAPGRHRRRDPPRPGLRSPRSTLRGRTGQLSPQPRRRAPRSTRPPRRRRSHRRNHHRHLRAAPQRRNTRSALYSPGSPRRRRPSCVLVAIGSIEPLQSNQPCHASPEQARSDPRPPSHVQMEDSACDTRELA